MNDFIKFVQENITSLMPLVFALVMLSQALLWVIKMFFIKPKINLYPTGPLSIALNSLGSTITMFGTLRVQRGDLFVSKIEALVSNSGGSRIFEWRALQPYTFNLLPTQENLPLELVSAFLLTPASPFKYNLVLVDEQLTKQCMPAILKLRNRWEESGKYNFSIFLKQDENVQQLLATLQQELYWQAGSYQFSIKIHTPKKVHTTTFQFELTPSQVNLLQDNFMNFIKLICDQPVRFDPVKCEYQRS